MVQSECDRNYFFFAFFAAFFFGAAFFVAFLAAFFLATVRPPKKVLVRVRNDTQVSSHQSLTGNKVTKFILVRFPTLTQE